MLRVPIYVAPSAERALSEPRESAMRAYARLQEAFTGSVGKTGTTAAEERANRAKSLAAVTYDELLRERLAYGAPQSVADRLVD
jgi:alkanesulfonate monooxygenase SsuD/methylene tetrahydromethanopterin reductase-like flavin-dependent oxidoreductase (luciferase family)